MITGWCRWMIRIFRSNQFLRIQLVGLMAMTIVRMASIVLISSIVRMVVMIQTKRGCVFVLMMRAASKENVRTEGDKRYAMDEASQHRSINFLPDWRWMDCSSLSVRSQSRLAHLSDEEPSATEIETHVPCRIWLEEYLFCESRR